MGIHLFLVLYKVHTCIQKQARRWIQAHSMCTNICQVYIKQVKQKQRSCSSWRHNEFSMVTSQFIMRKLTLVQTENIFQAKLLTPRCLVFLFKRKIYLWEKMIKLTFHMAQKHGKVNLQSLLLWSLLKPLWRIIWT